MSKSNSDEVLMSRANSRSVLSLESSNTDSPSITLTPMFDQRYFNMDIEEKLVKDIDMNNKYIKNLKEPNNEQDACNKKYIDDAIRKLKNEMVLYIDTEILKLSDKLNRELISYTSTSSKALRSERIEAKNIVTNSVYEIFSIPENEELLSINLSVYTKIEGKYTNITNYFKNYQSGNKLYVKYEGKQKFISIHILFFYTLVPKMNILV